MNATRQTPDERIITVAEFDELKAELAAANKSIGEAYGRVTRFEFEKKEAEARAERLREAIVSCVSHANGREEEWGVRAINAFAFLHAALQPAASADGESK